MPHYIGIAAEINGIKCFPVSSPFSRSHLTRVFGVKGACREEVRVKSRLIPGATALSREVGRCGRGVWVRVSVQ